MKRLGILLGLLFPIAALAQQGTTAGEEREVQIASGASMKFCWCPPGTFTMGEGNDRHQVILTRGFWIGKYEVTQEQWQGVMGSNPRQFTAPQNPVEQVSWNEVQEFLKRLGGGFRLPTEAEWEYACRDVWEWARRALDLQWFGAFVCRIHQRSTYRHSA